MGVVIYLFLIPPSFLFDFFIPEGTLNLISRPFFFSKELSTDMQEISI